MGKLKTSLTLIERIIADAPFLYEGDFSAGIRYAKRLGYDCVEIHATSADELNDPGLLSTLEEQEMQIGALGTGRLYVNAGLSLTDPEPTTRQETIRELKRFIEHAQRFHSHVILGCVRGNIAPAQNRPVILSRLKESLKELDAYASERSVTLVFEPINRYENNFLCSVDETADFLHSYPFASTKMMIDTFHMNIEDKDICQAIRDHCSLIVYAHFADSNRLWPGQGHLDFPLILETLVTNGYNGIISAECLPKPSKEEAAVNWLAAIKELLKRYE